jgi:hypothetical protein
LRELIEDLSHAEERVKVLEEALKSVVDKQTCVCRLIGYVGGEPPCDTCKLRAILEAK